MENFFFLKNTKVFHLYKLYRYFIENKMPFRISISFFYSIFVARFGVSVGKPLNWNEKGTRCKSWTDPAAVNSFKCFYNSFCHFYLFVKGRLPETE